MTTKTILRSGIAHAALLTSLAYPAHAQDEPFDLGELYLAGEKNKRTVENTSTSVQVITDEDIGPEDTDISEVLKTVPNVLEVSTGVAPTIRGLQSQGPQEGAVAFFAGTTPRATIQVDGRYQNYYEYVNGGTALWDVDTVEVYRGPQTTKQGANSIAGAMIVNTKDPTFEREASGQIMLGSYNMKRASFAVSGAISEDVALRFSADHYSRDNYVAVTDPTTLGVRGDRDYETQTYRAKLLWQPSSIAGLEAKLTYAHTDSNQPTSESVPFPFNGILETTSGDIPTWSIVSDNLIADVSYDFANGAVLTNQLTFGKSVSDRVLEDVEGGTAHVVSKGWSNELRVNFGDETSTYSGVVGLFYSETDQDDDINLVFRGNGGESYFANENSSLGLYGEAIWRPTSRLEVTGGLRFQRDEIQRGGTYESYVFGTSHQVNFDKTFTSVLPNVGIAYKPNEDTTVGFSVSKGHNPGGSGLNFVTSQYYEYDEESVVNYEAYLRSSLMGDRLFVAANLFYSDYKDQQVSYGRSTFNAERSVSYGLELAAGYQAKENLRFNFGVGLLQTEIREFSAAPLLVGNALDRAPNTTITIGADWDVTDKLTIGADARYVSSYYSDIDNTEAYKIDAYTTANLTASYDINDQFELYGYVNNLFDDISTTWVRGATGSYSARVTDPRMVGAGLRVQF